MVLKVEPGAPAPGTDGPRSAARRRHASKPQVVDNSDAAREASAEMRALRAEMKRMAADIAAAVASMVSEMKALRDDLEAVRESVGSNNAAIDRMVERVDQVLGHA